MSVMENFENKDENQIVEKTDNSVTENAVEETAVESEKIENPVEAEVPKKEAAETEEAETSEAKDAEKSEAPDAENPAEEKAAPAAQKEAPAKTEKKKKGFFARLLKAVIVFCAVIFALFSVLFLYSAIDSKNALTLFPKNYAAFVHTESVFDSLNPILDLEACDTFLADPEYSSLRPMFMDLRKNDVRRNKLIQFLLKRKANIAFYNDEDPNVFKLLAVADLSYLSFTSRLAPKVLPFIKMKELNGISVVHDSEAECEYLKEYITYETEDATFYIKTYKNLFIASDSKELLTRSLSGMNNITYSKAEEKEMTKTEAHKIKISADTKYLSKQFLKDDKMLENIHTMFDDEQKSTIQITISKKNISVETRLPLDIENSRFEAKKLFEHKSVKSTLVPELTRKTQYYTSVHIAPLSELKDASFPLLQKTQDIKSIWRDANKWSNRLLGLSVEDMLFSWSGSELGVIGMEGNSDPVFALQIVDETQRINIFKKLDSSWLIKDNSSLILGGARIPCLQLPDFITNLLSCFSVDLPKAYYFVHGNFIYFCLSPQNLSAIYAQAKENDYLVNTERWQDASGNLKDASSLSLYYNLERSMPFFITQNSMISKILKLYKFGRADVRIGENTLSFELNATSVKSDETKVVEGFPVECQGKLDYKLMISSQKDTVYWVENSRDINSFELDSLQHNRMPMAGKAAVAPLAKSLKDKGDLWALTSNGTVYLLNRSLKAIDKYPVIADSPANPFELCTTAKNELIYPTKDGRIVFYSTEKNKYAELPEGAGKVRTKPAVCENKLAFYAKGFDGQILYADSVSKEFDESKTCYIEGIGFGSPCLVEEDGLTYTAFVTQSGAFYLFKNNSIAPGFPVQLESTFHTNAAYLDHAFYLIGDDALVYKINMNGNYTTVQIPTSKTAKEGTITTVRSGKNKGVYASADENLIYGFNSDLELYPAFPLIGHGIPVFADVNGDSKDECIILSTDKKLYAWDYK